MGKAALATVALLAMPLGRAEAQVDLTRIPVPFLYLGDPLEAHPTGILFQSRGSPGSPFLEPPGVYRSGGTAATTRRLVVPGRPVHDLVGYRGQNVFLNAARTEWAPRDVFALELHSARAQRLVAGQATYGTAAGPGFFFVLEAGAVPGLYRTDGTAAGTRLVFPGPVADVTSIGKAVLFWSPLGPGNGYALYRAGGTNIEKLGEFPRLAGFTPFDYLEPVPTRRSSLFASFGERAAFLLGEADGNELWISDGTAEGTRLIHSTSEIVMHPPATCGNELLFFRGLNPIEPWATDGTPSGTRSLAPAILDFLQPSFRVIDAGGICYFVTGSGGPARLWSTDLTPAGTAAVVNIDYTLGMPQTRATGARGRVFFPKYGELWVSDGTEEGTRSLASGFTSAPIRLVHSAGRVFFDTYDSSLEASSLWVVHLPPALMVEDAEAIERQSGIGAMTFHVRLSRPSPTEVVVQFETEGGTAEPGEDFAAAQGSLRFSPGERLKLVRVRVTGDGVAEGAEHFKFRLRDPAGAEIERSLATGTIRDPGSDFRGPRR